MTISKSKNEQSQVVESAPKVVSTAIPEIFCDGVGQILLGGSVSKMTFYSDASDSEKVNVVRITMSTTALIRTCKRILSAAKQSEESMLSGNEKARSVLTTLLADVEPQKTDGLTRSKKLK
jgi:hypothetical protein